MPWTSKFGLRFNESSIHTNVPSRPGVFGIYNATGWLFIAKSTDLRNSLHNCFVQRNALWPDASPSGFTFEPCEPAKSEELRDQLILEYSPSGPRIAKHPKATLAQ